MTSSSLQEQEDPVHVAEAHYDEILLLLQFGQNAAASLGSAPDLLPNSKSCHRRSSQPVFENLCIKSENVDESKRLNGYTAEVQVEVPETSEELQPENIVLDSEVQGAVDLQVQENDSPYVDLLREYFEGPSRLVGVVAPR